jgi:hypothetical protein
MTPAVQIASVTVDPEVAAFAAGQGVSEHLPAVIEMTRRVFPGSALRVVLEDDPEIPNDWHIVILGRFHDATVEEAVERRWRWHGGLFECCPAPLASVFRIGMEWEP